MIRKTILVFLAAVAIAATSSSDGDGHRSAPVKGAKANTGYVTGTIEGDNGILPLSDDFKAPKLRGHDQSAFAFRADVSSETDVATMSAAMHGQPTALQFLLSFPRACLDNSISEAGFVSRIRR